MQYSNLLVHHLERSEIEHELIIRAVQFEGKDNLAALKRRLRDRLKEEKGKQPDIDSTRCDHSIDEEIKIIDANVLQIREILEHKVSFDGIKESLKTRLVHYFVRCSRAQEVADADNDLEDFDKLKGSMRELLSNYFSPFSNIPAVRTEMINEIVRTLSNMSLSQNSKQASNKSRSEDEELELGEGSKRQSVPLRSRLRRNLKSITPVESGLPRADTERVLRRFRLDCYNNDPRDSENDSDGNRRASSDSSRDGSPPRKSSRQTNRSYTRKVRHVSEWNLRYDGRDNGQNLMRFIREAEFLAKSEGISHRELFRSAIYLFQGQAKTWFMTGMENQEFYTWQDLVREMKKEFLSPDHDHASEIRAVSRKQGSKEKFQDFLFEMQKIFNSVTKPLSEGKKFEIVFRNMRSDYKGHAVASNIDNLADLKRFGRKLDATFWYKYNTISEESTRNRAHVNELRSGTKPKTNLGSVSDKSLVKSRNFYRSSNLDFLESDKLSKKPRESPKSNSESGTKSKNTVDGLQILIEKHIRPEKGMCFNCRLMGHSDRECPAPRHKFCTRCGFYNVDTHNCPWCEKNCQ